MSPRLQRTLAGPARVSGFGYWSSQDVTLELHPAPPDSGIVFVRTDLPGRPRVPALERYRFDVPRRTNLQCGAARVDMVEHVMAALAGLQIDNCEIWCDAAEMPGPDGSSQMFVAAMDSVGIVEQSKLRQRLIVRDTIRVEDPERGTWVEAQPHDGLQLEYQLDFPNTPIGQQTLQLELTPQLFRKQLASARTFIFKEEAEWLRQQNLGLRATNADLLVFDDSGPLDNELRFEDECVRHKTLDMVGDLALAGCDLVGKIVAHRSGHRLNAELVQRLWAAAQPNPSVTIPTKRAAS